MNAAALVMLASGLAVGFGWRPMPDGSSRYEYVVQIEPEMLEALADGQSIPIVAEVPEDVQAIGRIRIVVGRGELPHEQGVVRLRPVGDGDGAVTAEGGGDASTVELTQHSEAAPRYGAPVPPPQYGAPPSGATFDPYTEVPPTAGAPAGGSWNDDAAPVNPLRTAAADGAGGVSAWNGAAAGGPLAAVGDGIREATEPVREGIDRFGGRVRGAADDLGERTQELLDDLRPDALFGAGPADPVGGAAPPVAGAAPPAIPPVWNPGADAGAAPAWNGGDGAADAATAGAVPGAAPGGDAPGSSWNDGAGGAATAPDVSDAPPLVTGDGAPATVRGADADPWGNASDPRFRGAPAGGAPAGDAAGGTPPAGTLPWPGTAPLFPDATGAAAAADAGAGGAGPVLGGATGSPAISSDMLDQAATRPLDGGASLLDAAVAAPTGAAAAPAVPPATAQAWDGAEGRATTTTAATGGEPAAAPGAASSVRHKAAVIMAWVLLSGSAAGNIYLFWSYLDVRTKYRALVRKTARAVGSRFSAA